MTHYEVLGVAPTAGTGEIKRAYRQAARLHHPDVAGADHAHMQRLNQAWATLGDPTRRRAYDRALGIGAANVKHASPPPPPPPIVVDEEGETDWGPDPEPEPPSRRDIFLLVPVGLLACAALCVGWGALLYAPVLLGAAAFFFALAVLAFVLVPVLTLRRQAQRRYRQPGG